MRRQGQTWRRAVRGLPLPLAAWQLALVLLPQAVPQVLAELRVVQA